MSQLDFWKPNFLSNSQVIEIEKNFSSPVYVYSEEELEKSAKDFLAFPNAFWCDTRYAMKANSNINILKIFRKKWRIMIINIKFYFYKKMKFRFD